MIGIDTGVFVELLKGNPVARQVWDDVLGETEAVVSCISLYELHRLGLKGVIDRPSVDVLVDAIKNVCRIVWLDNQDIIVAAASLSHGLGLHMADALILTCFLDHGASTIYTVDPDLSAYRKKNLSVIMIKPC